MAAALSDEGRAVANGRRTGGDHAHVAAVESGGRGHVAAVGLVRAALNQHALIAAGSTGISRDGIADCRRRGLAHAAIGRCAGEAGGGRDVASVVLIHEHRNV